MSKRAGWVRLIGEGSEKQARRKELISSGGRKDVKQMITLRKGCLGESGGPSRGLAEGPQICARHRKRRFPLISLDWETVSGKRRTHTHKRTHTP